MPLIEIKNHRTGSVIFEGRYDSARAAVEDAVCTGVSLREADLRFANLAHAALDDAQLESTRLDGANLTGANLSEARLADACLANAALTAACLCFSSLPRCDFSGASFGGTDIAGADVSGSQFTTLSALSLNFIDAAALDNCLYLADPHLQLPFSKPPLVLAGLPLPVAALDTHMMVGTTALPFESWLCATNDNGRPQEHGTDRAQHLFRQYRPLLAPLIAARAGGVSAVATAA